MLFGGCLQTADAGTDDDADFVAVFLCEVEPCIQQRLIRGINTKLRKTVRAPDFLWRWKRGRGIKILHLAGDLTVERRRIKGTDADNAALTGNEVFPKNVKLMSQRRYHAKAGNDDTAFC